jgi:hypothetical protein
MFEWVSGVASTGWNWAKENSSIVNAVSGFVGETLDRIDTDDKAALMKSSQMGKVDNPSLSQYRTSVSRSNAGVSSYADIKEASGTKYAQFLYYTRSYLQTKAKYEGSVPRVSYKKSGLGSKS